jgi:membrane associated rhomboid family serine protease
MVPLRDTVRVEHFPAVNTILIALNVLMFFVELLAQANGHAERFVMEFGVIPARFLYYHDAREASTLITSMFFHGGWFHLFSNMLALYIFGDNLEDRMGPARYLIFYLLCGIAAGLTHVMCNSNSVMPSIGASGAIAGVLGAYLFLFPHARVLTLIPLFFFWPIIEIPAPLFLGFWFISQLLNGTAEIVQTVYSPEAREAGGVAWWAHVGGFASGASFAWFYVKPKHSERIHYA